MEEMKAPELTEEQRDWLGSKTENFDCIYIGIHGSHLYGLNREGSDIDAKAVYMPSKTDLLRGHAIKTHNYKNDELDIEIEIKSISSFLRSAESCDTNCIDLLHAPDSMALFKSKLWDELVKHRSGMYAKNMKGVVGYIKTHSKKYTNKIDRLNEMNKLKEITSNFCNGVHKVEDVTLCPSFLKENFKYIKVFTPKTLGEHNYLDVCGKKYIFTLKILDLKNALDSSIESYGVRSNKGADKGIDSKSLSHALRVLLQLKEIVTTKDLKFPLKNAEYVKAVKLGGVTDVVEVLDTIDNLYEECMELLSNSDFKEDVDITDMFNLLEEYYFD